MIYSIASILKKCSEGKTPDERVALLQQNVTPPIAKILQYAYEPTIKFLLPEGDPPYKPTDYLDQENRLYSEIRRMYLFTEGGNPNLTRLKREALFIQLLESVDKEDAKLLLAIKDKKLPYKGLNEKIVRKAFPGLLSEEGNEQDSKKTKT